MARHPDWLARLRSGLGLLLVWLAACQPLPATPDSRPTGLPTAASSPAPTVTAAPARVVLVYYPTPAISGDVLTFDARIELPPDAPHPLTATLALPTGPGDVAVGTWALGSHLGARWLWAWDTSGYRGAIPITMTLTWPEEATPPEPLTTVITVTLAEASTRPAYERQARWLQTETSGVRLHYLSGSAAERDLDVLRDMAQAAYLTISGNLGVTLTTPVDIYLMDRVYGQGGYATADWVAITYTDRNYAPAQLDLVLRHELTHRLDTALGCDQALTLVREGLAVYLSGGHYRREPDTFLLSSLRAEALYLPLETLTQDFYSHQHEISYLEAASLVAFVDTVHGRVGLRTFCVATAPQEDRDERARLAAGAQALGYRDIQELEQAWWAWAEKEPPDPRTGLALRVETALLDTMRAYQQAYDPVAYYLTGVLYDPQAAEARGLTTDFLRAPQSAEAITLELLLKQGVQAFESGHLERAARLTDEVQHVLAQGFPASGLAADVLALVRASQAEGYLPYAVTATGAGRYVLQATRWENWPRRVLLLAESTPTGWRLSFFIGLDQP